MAGRPAVAGRPGVAGRRGGGELREYCQLTGSGVIEILLKNISLLVPPHVYYIGINLPPTTSALPLPLPSSAPNMSFLTSCKIRHPHPITMIRALAILLAGGALASTCIDEEGNSGPCMPGREFCGKPFTNAPSYHLMDRELAEHALSCLLLLLCGCWLPAVVP